MSAEQNKLSTSFSNISKSMSKIAEGFEGLARAFEGLSGDPTFGLAAVNPADVAATKGKAKKSRKKYDEDGNEIKRPPSKYNQFVKDNMQSVKDENQGLSSSEIFAALAKKWHASKGDTSEKEPVPAAAPESTAVVDETTGMVKTENADGVEKKKKKKRKLEETVEEGADVGLKKEKKKKKKKDKEAKDK